MAEQIPLVDYLVLDGEPHLIANACEQCGALYLERRNACGRCGGTSFGRRRLAGEGTLRAFTIVHRAAPGVPAPYISTVVDVDGGGVVKANLVDTPPEPGAVRLGSRVRLATFVAGVDDNGVEAVAFGYRPE